MPAKVKVWTNSGSTEGSVAYYAEAEPRLLKIREAFLSGKRDEQEVRRAVQKIAGRDLLGKDWREVTKDLKTYAEKEIAWRAHERANPVHCRLYGHEDVIAAFVMHEDEKG